jgi:hypothetical protein
MVRLDEAVLSRNICRNSSIIKEGGGMPSISGIKILGNVLFFAKQYKLPGQFQKPQGDPKGNQYGNAFQASDRVAIPQTIPPWFTPAELPNKYYQDTCDKIGNDFKDIHDSCIDAVAYAFDMWKLQANFKNLQVMSVSAIGTPGCLDGPELESFIKNAPMTASFSGNKGKYRDAVASGVSKAFKDWQGKVMIPGLPLFPAFAAFPGPMAPPMPSVPVPLIACPSAMMASILAPSTMKQNMIDALDGGLKSKDKDKHHEGLFEAIATVLSLAFIIWLASQQVMLVMGKGPIPSFAPPFVPVGPVVGGDNLSNVPNALT